LLLQQDNFFFICVEKVPFRIVSLDFYGKFAYTNRDITIYLYNEARMQIYNSPVLNPTTSCSSGTYLGHTFPGGFPPARYLRVERTFDSSFGAACTCGCPNPSTFDLANQLDILELYVYSTANNTSVQCTDLNVTLSAPFYNGTFDETAFVGPDYVAEGWVFNRSDFSSTTVGCGDIPITSRTVYARFKGLFEKTCNGRVNVRDNVPPIAQCLDLNLTLTNTDLVRDVWASSINNASSDACTSVEFSLDRNVVTCPEVGTLPVTMTVKDLSGNVATCTSMVTVMDATVNTNASFTAPATITKGTAVTICNDNLFLTGINNEFQNATWTQTSGAPVVISNPTGSSCSLSEIPYGNTQIRYTTVADGCVSSSAFIDITRVERFDNVTSGVVGFSASTESLERIVNVGCLKQIQMYGSTPSFGDGRWNAGFDFGGFPTILNNTDSNTLVNITGPEPFYMTWKITSSDCFPSVRSRTLVNVAQLDRAQILTPNTVLPCGVTSYEVRGFLQTFSGGCSGSKRRNSATSAPGEPEFVWEREPCGRGLTQPAVTVEPSLSVMWSVVSQPFGGNAQIINATFPTMKVTNLAIGSTVLQYSLSGPNCVTKSATVTLKRPDSVGQSNAGPDQDIGCRTSTYLHATARADVNVGGEPEFNPMGNIGKWSVVSGQIPSFNEFTHNTQLWNINGTVVMRWTITSPDCPQLNSFDDVTIKQYSAVSPANAGGNKVVNCARAVQLNAVAPAFGRGRWSIASGRAKLGNPLDPQKVLTSINNETITLWWNVTGDSCSMNSSDVIFVQRTAANCSACREIALADENIVNSCDPPSPLFLTSDVDFNFAVTFTEFESSNASFSFSGESFRVSGTMMLRNSRFSIGSGKNATLGALAVDDGSTVDLSLGAELTVGGDLAAGKNVSFSFAGANIKVSGSFTLSSSSNLNVDTSGSINAKRMIFAGQLFLKVLQLVLSRPPSRDNVVGAATIANPSTSTPVGGVLLTSEVAVATFESGDGSFTGTVLDYQNACDTVVSSEQTRSAGTLSVTVSVSRDTSIAGCELSGSSGGGGLSTGAIVGIVIGSLALVVLFVILLVWWRKREVAKANARFIQSQHSKRNTAFQNEEA
jgi:hypothetical protein